MASALLLSELIGKPSGSTSPVSPRPVHSALDLAKIEAAGYTPADWEETLKEYVTRELNKR